MLLELSIANFAIIEELRIAFSPGMNVITGETGAGKSILLQALGLLCGKKMKPGAARDPEKPVWVEALFSGRDNSGLSKALAEMGLGEVEDEILIRREILPAGRNRVSLNGRILRVRDLQDLSPYLVNIHSQFDSYQLLDSSTHFRFICGVGQEAFEKALSNYSQLFQTYKELFEKRQTAEERVLEIQRTRAHLEQEIEEISQVSPREGEEEELNQEHQVLANFESIQAYLEELRNLLDRGEAQSLPGMFYQVSKTLDSLRGLDGSASALWESFEELSIRLEEFCDGVGTYQNQSLQESSRSLEDVESRIGEIERLKSKYGTDIPSILDYESQAAEKLFKLGKEILSLEGLDEEIGSICKKLQQASRSLFDQKKIVGELLEQRVNAVLKKLALPDASFHVHFEPYSSGLPLSGEDEGTYFGPEGTERVEFLFTPHQSQVPKPLKLTASGGEISRVMLALKACFATVHTVQSFIFDEIDTGIGGETAHDLAHVLAELSRDRQSIVITHLPQIAVRAQEHLRVEKDSSEAGLFTRVLTLSSEQAREEVGRMMGVRSDGSENRQRMARVLEAQSTEALTGEKDT